MQRIMGNEFRKKEHLIAKKSAIFLNVSSVKVFQLFPECTQEYLNSQYNL